MFSEVFKQLKNSHTFSSKILLKRLNAAITKKLGVISLPYHFWSADKKINPLTEHLLWAAILLEDQEKFSMVEGIIIAEYKESLRTNTLNNPDNTTIQSLLEKTVTIYVNNFLNYFSDDSLQEILTHKIQTTLPSNTYKKLFIFDQYKIIRLQAD